VSKSSTKSSAAPTYVKPVSSGPLQVTVNTIATSPSYETSTSGERLALGTTDSNVVTIPDAAPAAVPKPVKRAAAGNIAGAEKRKKALKRL
jgi:hypothetical protein